MEIVVESNVQAHDAYKAMQHLHFHPIVIFLQPNKRNNSECTRFVKCANYVYCTPGQVVKFAFKTNATKFSEF